MMQTSQLPPALEALMSMGARPTAPGPGGQPVPTVAANIAQQQSPAGIEAVMPGVQQQAMNMAQAQKPVMMGELPPQLQQAIQQARGPQGQGVAGLPAPNMSFADGGVVGYSGEFGSYVQDAEAIALDELRVAENRRRREEEERRRKEQAPVRSVPKVLTEEDELLGPMRTQKAAVEPQVAPAAPPQFNLNPNNPQALNALRRAAMSATGVERQSILNKIAELEAAQPSRSMAPETSGITAALPARPTLDRAGVEAAGKQYPQQTQDRIRRMQEIERQRSEMAKSMPDLNAEGIAALESANRARQEMLAKQRADDKFNRRIALYDEMSGKNRSAWGNTVANQQARDQAANQAELLHKQAVIKLREAQQAKQLGQFDRALGFEKEAAELENKANDFELRAKQIATQMATSEFSGLVSLRGQDMQAQRELKSMAPAEQMMAEKAINDWLGKNPGKSYSDAVEWYKTIGQRTPPTDRSVITYDQAADNVTKFMESMAGLQEIMAIKKRAKDSGQPEPSMSDIRAALIRREMEGGGRTPVGAAPATQLPPAALAQLKSGVVTTFANGQQWTLENGQPKQVK